MGGILVATSSAYREVGTAWDIRQHERSDGGKRSKSISRRRPGTKECPRSSLSDIKVQTTEREQIEFDVR